MIDGKTRREKIINMIAKNSSPVSGSKLAADFGVSRQVIVQDIALLRTAGYDIISTNRGYILNEKVSAHSRVYKVSHTDAQTEDELCTIVDLGGTVVDVFVSHRVYGLIKVNLNIRSRRNVADFINDLKSGKSTPLKNITSDYHYHTVSADSERTLDIIYDALASKGYLVKIDDWDWDSILSS